MALLAVACALALAGCEIDGQSNLSAAQPRGASVAFDSIDGIPPVQFQVLVHNLNDEAQTRRLAVVSRDNPSTYRVRGYLAAEIAKNRTTVTWVWDVFDRDEHRVLRISGAQSVDGRQHEGWQAIDDATLRHIAHRSMDRLAAFLTSPDVAPGMSTPVPAQVALTVPASSPEAAGIFRIFHPHADPVAATDAPPSTDGNIAPTPASIPLPPRRPPPASTVSARQTLTLAAARRARY